ncbi:MAG: tetratricopeptide repeat protein, partial [Candidatus Kapaibacterium sp.]
MVAFITIYAAVIVLLVPSVRCGAQESNSRQYLELGEMYVKTGNLDAAITEFYRHIYIHPNEENIREAYIKLGNALRDSGKQLECLRALSMAMEKSTTQLSRAQTRLELATAHLLFDQPLQAQLVLFRVLASPPADSSILSRAYL